MDDRYWVKLPARHAGALGGDSDPVGSFEAGPPIMLMAPWSALVGILGSRRRPSSNTLTTARYRCVPIVTDLRRYSNGPNVVFA